MIVLDENITRQSVLAGLQWYEGKVVSIKTLRPNTVIKDEAIPSLLSKQKQPIFVTTDVSGFWKKVKPHPKFCIVCVPLPDYRLCELPLLLRRLFRTEGFRTKRKRMGKVALVTETTVRFYAFGQLSITEIPLAK
jgi:hypothetical protein